MTHKPLLKWAGGKRWLVPLLDLIWKAEQLDTLIEPFTGGMSVALGLTPSHALLNDNNAHLINFYNQVKQGLRLHTGFKNEAAYYYQMRSEFNKLIHLQQCQSREAASLFYFLIRTGFNGLCRFNQSGEFNVPFGQHKTIHYKSDFNEYRSILSPWQFTQGDFENIPLTGHALIYADPPYDVPFRQYCRQGFEWQDQVRLVEWLNLHEGPVIASNQATDRVLKLYKKHNFKVFKLLAPRRIACNGNRQPALEMFALKNCHPNCVKAVRKFIRMLN